MLFALNRFSFAALKPVGVAALGPVAFIAHTNKISFIATALKEAAFTFARGLDVAFVPTRKDGAFANVFPPAGMRVDEIPVGLGLDAAIKGDLVKCPSPMGAM